MGEVLSVLRDTPIPTILVISGIIFLVLAISDQIAGKIAVNPGARKYAAIIGGILVIVGIALYLVPVTQEQISASDSTPQIALQNNPDKPAIPTEDQEPSPKPLPSPDPSPPPKAEENVGLNKLINVAPIKATLVAVRFYEAGVLGKPLENRIYRKRFAKAITDYVWCEIVLIHPNLKTSARFTLDVAYRVGSRSGKAEVDTQISPEWQNSSHWVRLTGATNIGTYYVTVYINGEKVHTDSFEVH